MLFCGCVATHSPQIADTKFDEAKRDWVEIYKNEINIAIENNDGAAYQFFLIELIKEKTRVWKEKQSDGNKTKSPSLP